MLDFVKEEQGTIEKKIKLKITISNACISIYCFCFAKLCIFILNLHILDNELELPISSYKKNSVST